MKISKKEKTEKILCPACGIFTNHKIVWGFNRREEEEDSGIWEETEFEVLQCLGCETPSLRKKYMFSEDLDIRVINGEDVALPQITLWPRTGYRMLKQKSLFNAPQTVRRIYRETIEAYNSELPTLCAAGARAIIEAVCKDKSISGEDLMIRINKLKDSGLITSDIAEALHENRLLGNDALHDSTLFGDIELQTSIELIESFLEIIYETKNKKDRLKILRESKKKG